MRKSHNGVCESSQSSYLVPELLVKSKSPQTVAETWTLPACKAIVNKMLGPDAVKEVAKIHFLDNTIARWISGMFADIESIVLWKLVISRKFGLQRDESTDVSGNAQLLANVPFF